MQVKVEGTNYVKDMSNKALLNTNKSAILENEARKKIRQNLLSKNEEINTDLSSVYLTSTQKLNI